MFNELKKKLAIKWLNQNKNAPKLSLRSTDKLYLAVSKKSVGNLIYVYSLVNLKKSGNKWELGTTTEVSTFDRKKDAEIFYKTIMAVMELQHKNSGVQAMVNIYQNEIKKFKENTR